MSPIFYNRSQIANLKQYLTSGAIDGFITALSITLIWNATKNGVGLGPDSVSYILSAREFLTSGAFDRFSSHWPPGYPLLLAGMAFFFKSDPLLIARWVACICFALTVFATLRLSRFLMVNNQSLGVPVIALALITATHFSEVFWMASSEAPFIALLIMALLCYALYIKSHRTLAGFWVATVVCLAALSVVRYVALPFIVGFVLIEWMYSSTEFWKRTRNALVMGLISCGPLAFWLIFNFTNNRNLTSRSFNFHPISLAHAEQFLSTLGEWVGMAQGGLLLILFTVVAGFAVCSREGAHIISRLLVILSSAYLVFLVFSISFLDAYTPLDQRILAPLFPIFLLLAAAFVDHLNDLGRAAAWVMLGIILVVTAYKLPESHDRLGLAIQNGIGYESRYWQASQILKIANELAPAGPIYANGTETFYLYLNRQVNLLPRWYLPVEAKINPRFNDEMKIMIQKIEQEKGIIVWFKANTYRHYLPGPQKLVAQFPLKVLVEFNDGLILVPEDLLYPEIQSN